MGYGYEYPSYAVQPSSASGLAVAIAVGVGVNSLADVGSESVVEAPPAVFMTPKPEGPFRDEVGVA